MHQIHKGEKSTWYGRLQRSWTINAIVIPTAIALICHMIFQWMK
jgi:hypothetical protein